MSALRLGHVRPASTDSEAVSWYVLLGVSKKYFWGRDRSQKSLSDLDLWGPYDLKIQVRPPRPIEVKLYKIVILPCLKNGHFYVGSYFKAPTWGH